MLHVTNGSSVSLDQSGLDGEIMTWMDSLHEGPVPAGLNLEELRTVRGSFLDELWQLERPAAELLEQRDCTLQQHAANDEITLWFEHDLFDQLQLIQILDRLRNCKPPRLICVDQYLGPLTGPQLAALWPLRHVVTEAEMNLASSAWDAFRSPDPTAIERLLRQDTSALPFLAGALLRHLQQFPSTENGLARTEHQILRLVGEGHHDFHALFPAEQQLEERIFMGDEIVHRYLRGLCDAPHPLLREEGGRYSLTPVGADVLACRADHVQLNGIDRWLGGVHLLDSADVWRWDSKAGALSRFRDSGR